MRAFKRGLLVTAVVAAAIAAAPAVASAALPNYLVDANGDPVPVGTTITAKVTDDGVSLWLFDILQVDRCFDSKIKATVVQNEWDYVPALIASIFYATFSDCLSEQDTTALNLDWCLNAESALSGDRVGGSLGYRDTSFDEGEPCGDVDVELGSGLGKWKGKLIDGVNGGEVAWYNPNSTEADEACGPDTALIRLDGAWELVRYDPTPSQPGGTVSADYCIVKIDGVLGGELYVID